MYGLLKLANEGQGPWGEAALAGAGGLTTFSAKDRLLGRKTLFHGTTADNAAAIKREGFKLSDGSGGASEVVADADYIANSKGKVHLTPRRGIANGFGAIVSDDELRDMGRTVTGLEGDLVENLRIQNDIPADDVLDHIKARHALENQIEELGNQIGKRTGNLFLGNVIPNPMARAGETLRLSVPYDNYRMMEPDPDMRIGREGWMTRQLAVRTDAPPDSKYIRGAVDDLGRAGRLKESLRLLPGYVKAHPGRFASGAGLAGAGLTGVGIAGMGLAKHDE